jgi:hypothetical protein
MAKPRYWSRETSLSFTAGGTAEVVLWIGDEFVFTIVIDMQTSGCELAESKGVVSSTNIDIVESLQVENLKSKLNLTLLNALAQLSCTYAMCMCALNHRNKDTKIGRKKNVKEDGTTLTVMENLATSITIHRMEAGSSI